MFSDIILAFRKHTNKVEFNLLTDHNFLQSLKCHIIVGTIIITTCHEV